MTINWKLQAFILSASLWIAAPAAFGGGAEVYAKNCASCHGKDGKGETVMGKKAKVKDYTDAKVQASFTDAEALKMILEGKEKMKAYKDKVTEAEAKELVAYIRTFKK
ncbi:MAG: cytochrome c [Verrucomicrobia bacterium]|nr:MAG: cytochrome c [Verrucomicrobiota bacterium]